MADNETTADIIAWLRRPREGENAYLTLWRDEIADRLDAAHKRELSKNTSKNVADFGQLGDAAKLREALVQAELFVGNIVRHGHQTLVPGDKCTACDGAEELRDMICAALAEPVKNCEVGTAKEQVKRWRRFCNSMTTCGECPLHKSYSEVVTDCFSRWAQMSYKEGGDDGR